MGMASASPPNVVIFPFMAQGHTRPLLDLSKALTVRGLKVSVITTPSNAPYIRSNLCNHPQISVMTIPFPQAEGVPEGCENTAHLPSMDLVLTFINATKKLKGPFDALLRDMSESGRLPICVISDFFLTWTADSCCSVGVPRLISHGMSVLSMAIVRTVGLHGACIEAALDEAGLRVPFTLTPADLPDSVRAPAADNPWLPYFAEMAEADGKSWGVIVNSFQELEGEYLRTFESTLPGQSRAWCVGPLLLFDDPEEWRDEGQNQSWPYIKWLDEQVRPDSVVYVCFGTQARVSAGQMDEVALGLEMAGHPFIWVLGSTPWTPPDGWEDRVKGRAFIARGWVEQRSILAHSSTGGFVSHCGWNSVLEGMSMGVPMLGWPMGAEQALNARFMGDGLGMGMVVQLGDDGEDGMIRTVGRDAICDGVKKLMDSKEGRKARERAQALMMVARQAVKKGGSSDQSLDKLIRILTAQAEKSRDVRPCLVGA